MQFIKYIGVYDIERKGKLQRDCSLAAIKKMDYIIDSINSLGKPVQVISIARDKIKSQGKSIEKISDNNELILAPSIGSRNKLKSQIGELQIRIWLFIWLILNIKKNEKIMVYHSQRIMNIIYWASKIKSFSYILEVEELYYKFGFVKKREEKKEKRCIYNAQSLIVSTNNIIKELSYKKNYIQLHGNYRNIVNNKRKKDNINVVFAGGIETIRNTAFNVCDCAKYLDNNFKVYLLGYGDEKDIAKLKKKIEEINKGLGEKRIIYCGTKIGQEYDDFMSKCDIAINFQNMDEYYMNYAFPSKVLNYLNYGLVVVTTPLETIRQSEINKLVLYPENMENTAESFAVTIREAKNHLNEHKQLISDEMVRMDEKFKEELKLLL